MARWVNLDDCVEISAGEMRFYPVELLGDVYEEVAPVVHAHWIDTLYGWKCSNCKEEQEYTLYLKHCPNCGAKMDEEVEDG